MASSRRPKRVSTNAIAVAEKHLGVGATNNAIAHIPDTLVTRVQSIFFRGNPGARAEKKRLDLVRKGFVML